MQTKPPHSCLDHDEKLRLDVDGIVAMLPGSKIEDFLNAQPLSTFSSAADRGWKIFECKIDGEQLALLQSVDCQHPLWEKVCNVYAAAESRKAALALPEHLALLVESDLERPARILVIPDSDLARVLQTNIDSEQLTNSELRLLKQLICGLGLSEAAKIDGVSHETKRTQYKSLSRKLAARSQSELTNKVLARLLFDPHLSINDKTTQVDEYFIELVREFMPLARCFQLLGADGKRHRFVDIGPVAGRPVALVHPMILPDIRQEEVAFLHDQGLRLIVPLRSGALSKAGARLSVTEHLDYACEGIDLVRTHFSGEKLDLILCISGCAYGIEYAQRHPDRVRSLALVGACVQSAAGTGVAGRLRASFFSLARTNWQAYSAILMFFGRRICQPDTLRQLLHRYYRPCSADLAIVQAEYASSQGGGACAENVCGLCRVHDPRSLSSSLVAVGEAVVPAVSDIIYSWRSGCHTQNRWHPGIGKKPWRYPRLYYRQCWPAVVSRPLSVAGSTLFQIF